MAVDSFSSCYGQDSRQEDIFETDVKPLIEVVYSGAVRYTDPLSVLHGMR